MPETSILIRAFNEEKHIGDLLAAIERQEYRDYEIVLVDSGSSDRTLEIATDRVHQLVQIESHDFTFGYSLNVGCKTSRGAYVVMVSAHAIPVDTKWLESLVSWFRSDRVAMTYGRHVGAPGSKFSEARDFSRLFGTTPRSSGAPTYYANNANSAIRSALWERRPFDENLPGLEDIAWARAFIEEGYEVRYEPGAAVFHIHEESWHQVWNRYRREAVAARHIGLKAPPHASPSAFFFIGHLFADLASSLAAKPRPKIHEVVGFRSQQWKGSREGWAHDIDLREEREDLYFSGVNRAVVIRGKHNAALEDKPIPELRPGEVLVKVAYVGVCRTDLEIFEKELGYYKDGTAHYPITPGHEFSGTVVRVGANHGGVKVGDRVVGECLLVCERCASCRSGFPGGCTRRREVGVVNADGAYATYVAMPARNVHKVPDGVDLKTAALCEPLAVVGKALRRSGVLDGRSISDCAVVGAGPIGQLFAQVLASKGAKVTVFDRDEDRLSLLPDGVSRATEIDRRLASFRFVVEATGHADALDAVLRETGGDSTILLMGFPYGAIHYNFEDVVARDRVILGSVGSSSIDFRWALDKLPALRLEAFTKTVLPLTDFAQAWNLQRHPTQLKILLRVSGE